MAFKTVWSVKLRYRVRPSLQSIFGFPCLFQRNIWFPKGVIMSENPKPESHRNPPPKPIPEIGNKTASDLPGHQKLRYPNPPDLSNPDPSTLRDQWRYAIRQYSRWYSHAWGTAILAGVSFFALGWLIKGSNPLPSFNSDSNKKDNPK